MEETIGYEALFSAEEWDSMTFGEWTDDDNFDPEGNGSPSGHSGSSTDCSEV